MISPELQAWQERGSYISFGPFGHQVFAMDLGDRKATVDRTLLLIHGFPESSYSYHAVIDGLLSHFDRIVLYDMLGYGPVSYTHLTLPTTPYV